VKTILNLTLFSLGLVAAHAAGGDRPVPLASADAPPRIGVDNSRSKSPCLPTSLRNCSRRRGIEPCESDHREPERDQFVAAHWLVPGDAPARLGSG